MQTPKPIEREENDKTVQTFRIFFWGLPSPSGKTYTKEVADFIVDSINSQGMLASFADKLNIHLVSGYVNNAEIKGNVVYADIGILEDQKSDIPDWGDGNYRATAVLKVKEGAGDRIDIDNIESVSHILIYR